LMPITFLLCSVYMIYFCVVFLTEIYGTGIVQIMK
jgi:hypothetical protein